MGKSKRDELRIRGPKGPYRCIYLDPPWLERGGGRRGANMHYDLMKTSDIDHLVLRVLKTKPLAPPFDHVKDGDLFDLNPSDSLIADDAHCWMWVTDNYLRDGLYIMERMGFEYKRTLVWGKLAQGNVKRWAKEMVQDMRKYWFAKGILPAAKVSLANFLADALTGGSFIRGGIGQYARGSHEILLLGSRGSSHLPPTKHRPKSLQLDFLKEHSQKPERFYDIIEGCSPGPRLEMFARNRRPGWASWGNDQSLDN